MTSPLEQATRDLLRSRADSLDGRVRSRLNRARQVALDELAPASRWSRTPFLPLAAALCAALVALVLLLPHGAQRSPGAATSVVVALDDSDLMGAGGEGLLDEDPTLFALAAADEAAQ